jgi:hypothetical protein
VSLVELRPGDEALVMYNEKDGENVAAAVYCLRK